MTTQRLSFVNTCGLILITVLCIAQWSRNRTLNHHNISLGKDLDSIRVELEEKNQTILEHEDDGLRFAETIADLRDQLKEAKDALESAKPSNSERDTFEATAESWRKAIEARDARLLEYESTIENFVSQLNERTAEYNSLAERVNELTEELDERTRQYNELLRKR